MATRIGRISTIKRKGHFAPDTINESLQRSGLTRAPKTKMIMYPAKNLDGSYRTGLDPNAHYISAMSKEEAKMEKERINGFLEIANNYYPDIDLGPRAPFWKDMVKRSGDADVAPVANLVDGDNYYDFSNPQSFIVYMYLRVHPMIAPSGQAVLQGDYSRCNYYVNDYDVETALAFKVKDGIAKAVAKIGDMPLEKRKMVARQLNLGVSPDSREQAVYVMLFDYINASTQHSKKGNIDLFNTFADMKDDNLLIRDIVSEAFDFGILRQEVNKEISRSGKVVAKNREALVTSLASPKNQGDLISLQEELKVKHSQQR